MDNKTKNLIKKRISFILKMFLIFLELLIFIFVFYRYQNVKETNEIYVSSVIDGDTFKLSNNDIIRLLCVDTPEKGSKGYEDAKNFLEDLVLNKDITKEISLVNPRESFGEDYLDKYNRKLRFVYLNKDTLNEIFVNQEIINQDYGELFIYNNSNECERITLLNNSS
jgi:endonuclease YncB( thermonuclease family)